MTTTISEYINVRQRISDLGCLSPAGLALLPSNFETASDISAFRQVSESATVRTLLRTSGVPLDELLSKEQRPPYIQNNAFEWVPPILFVSVGVLSQNASYLSVALSVIANYLTDFFKGMSGENQVQMDIVVERSKNKVCKKITYKGPPAGLKDLILPRFFGHFERSVYTHNLTQFVSKSSGDRSSRALCSLTRL